MTLSRRSIAALAAAAAAAAALLAAALLLAPASRADAVEGSFANDCCGTLRLEGGRIFLEGKPAVTYTIGRDAAGPYILPSTYVGPWEEQGFEIDGTRPALKIRLDQLPAPQRLTVGNGKDRWLFKRERPRRR
jgi:hypothetical protein